MLDGMQGLFGAIFGVGAMALWGGWRLGAMARVRPDNARRDSGRTWRWEAAYIDDEGRLVISTLQVKRFDAESRRVVAWCTVRDCEQQLKPSRLVRVVDVPTGRQVDVRKWALWQSKQAQQPRRRAFGDSVWRRNGRQHAVRAA